jgi:KDO2-lipid IV(A) lauroyltransferase
MGQRAAWTLVALAFDLFAALLRLLPVDAASWLGGAFVKGVGPMTRVQRIVDRNLRLAFPQLGAEERRRLSLAQWESAGRYFVELTMMDRLTPASGRVEVVGAERLEQIAREGGSAVFISGHFSNFEIMPAAILAAGIDCQITYRASNNPYVERSIMRSRRRYGVRYFAPRGPAGSRELLRAIKRGESVALMNDQRSLDGVDVLFFGHPARTATGPTRMALSSSGRLQPLSVQRLKGARFRVVVHEPIVLERTGDRQADFAAGARQVNAFVEARVRERPEEWFWPHRRWNEEAYATLKD